MHWRQSSTFHVEPISLGGKVTECGVFVWWHWGWRVGNRSLFRVCCSVWHRWPYDGTRLLFLLLGQVQVPAVSHHFPIHSPQEWSSVMIYTTSMTASDKNMLLPPPQIASRMVLSDDIHNIHDSIQQKHAPPPLHYRRWTSFTINRAISPVQEVPRKQWQFCDLHTRTALSSTRTALVFPHSLTPAYLGLFALHSIHQGTSAMTAKAEASILGSRHTTWALWHSHTATAEQRWGQNHPTADHVWKDDAIITSMLSRQQSSNTGTPPILPRNSLLLRFVSKIFKRD